MRSCDKVHRRDILERAWVQVRANKGAPGIDRITIADVEAYGAHRLLEELSADVRGEQWRPLPARRVWILKARRLRTASALDPRRARPHRAGGGEDRHRAGL